MVTPSPIIEMPPSPAPAQLLIVEFPDDDGDDDDSSDLIQCDNAIVEGEDTDVAEDFDEDSETYFGGVIEVRAVIQTQIVSILLLV